MTATSIIGTNHYTSFRAAATATVENGDASTYDRACVIVRAQIKSGEIEIGKPTLKPGEKLSSRHGRYFIEG